MSKYTSEEILQIQLDFYKFQSVFDPEVQPGAELTFDTLITDWCDICDLLGPKELAVSYHQFYQLTAPVTELQKILSSQKNTLKDFCNYIAANAERQQIKPVTMLGKSCITAAIFKTLVKQLQQEGVDISAIKPSSEFAPVFKERASAMLGNVSKLTPGLLKRFTYQQSRFSKIGNPIMGYSFLALIIVSIVWHFHWVLLVPFGAGIIFSAVGHRHTWQTLTFVEYRTFRDLVLGMEAQLVKR